MWDWEYFCPRLRLSGIHFSIAQVRAASAQTRRETRISCRHGAAPSPCPVLVPSHHTLIHFPLITLRRFLFLRIPPRPPVGVLTFPPLHLPPSPSSPPSPLLHSPPLPSLPIYFESHAGPVPQNLKPRASGLVVEAGGEGGREGGQRGHYQDVTVWVETVPLGDAPPTESHLRTCQPDKHKWVELVDAKAPQGIKALVPF